MTKARVSGVLVAVIGLLGLIYFLVSGANFPLTQWPYEAFQSLVFSIVLGFHASTSIAYIVSGMVVVTVLVVCFAVGHKLARCIWSQDDLEIKNS